MKNKMVNVSNDGDSNCVWILYYESRDMENLEFDNSQFLFFNEDAVNESYINMRRKAIAENPSYYIEDEEHNCIELRNGNDDFIRISVGLGTVFHSALKGN